MLPIYEKIELEKYINKEKGKGIKDIKTRNTMGKKK